MCCNNGGSWKREVVPDHKFDFIDTREFHSKSFGIRMRYLWLYILVVKSFLVYVSDIYTAVIMLTSKDWSNTIFISCKKGDGDCSIIPFKYGKWLFVGCIIISFLLLAYEAHKAKKIIASRDISYAFSNVMANNYYSLRSYDHFCFFCHINNSTKKKDDFAFFVFFTFKSWKRLLFADTPRQVINATTLISFYLAKNVGEGHDTKHWYDLSKYTTSFVTGGLIISLVFTVLVCAGSLLLLVAAGICYVPLLCYIQGNLKEYCCHKIDKRISELMKKKNAQRKAKAAELARKEAAGDFSHLQNKKGEFVAKPLPQPTLPSVALDDFGSDTTSMRTRVEPDYYNSKWQKDQAYSNTPIDAAPDYPPMPPYQAYAHTGYDYQYDSASMHEHPQYAYDDRYNESQVALTQAAEPISGHLAATGGMPNPYSAQGEHFPVTAVDTYDYNGGLAYDDHSRPAHNGYQHNGSHW